MTSQAPAAFKLEIGAIVPNRLAAAHARSIRVLTYKGKSMHMGMNGFGMIFPVLAYLVVIGIPAAVVIGKAGYSRAWVILAFIPIINLIALWVFAFAKWPALHKPQ